MQFRATLRLRNRVAHDSELQIPPVFAPLFRLPDHEKRFHAGPLPLVYVHHLPLPPAIRGGAAPLVPQVPLRCEPCHQWLLPINEEGVPEESDFLDRLDHRMGFCIGSTHAECQ